MLCCVHVSFLSVGHTAPLAISATTHAVLLLGHGPANPEERRQRAVSDGLGVATIEVDTAAGMVGVGCVMGWPESVVPRTYTHTGPITLHVRGVGLVCSTDCCPSVGYVLSSAHTPNASDLSLASPPLTCCACRCGCL